MDGTNGPEPLAHEPHAHLRTAGDDLRELGELLSRFPQLFPDKKAEAARAFLELAGMVLRLVEKGWEVEGDKRKLCELTDRAVESWGAVESLTERRRLGRADGMRRRREARSRKQKAARDRLRAEAAALYRRNGSKSRTAELLGIGRERLAKILRGE